MNEQIKVGRPRKAQYGLRSKNDERADLIRQARFSENVCKSLQLCAVKDNRPRKATARKNNCQEEEKNPRFFSGF